MMMIIIIYNTTNMKIGKLAWTSCTKRLATRDKVPLYKSFTILLLVPKTSETPNLLLCKTSEITDVTHDCQKRKPSSNELQVCL